MLTPAHICHRCIAGRGTKFCCPEDGKPIAEHAHARQCPLGLFAEADQAGTLSAIAHGAAGLAKAVLHIDRASDETIAARRSICAGCPESKSIGGIVMVCNKCGCAWGAKIVIESEKCPLPVPKW